MTTTGNSFVIMRDDLQSLFDAVIARGYVPVGPTVREGVIAYDELRHVQDLPEGWTEDQDAGACRLKRRDDRALFGFNNGPHSWKNTCSRPKPSCGKGTGPPTAASRCMRRKTPKSLSPSLACEPATCTR